MVTLTTADIPAIRARADAATAGPWVGTVSRNGAELEVMAGKVDVIWGCGCCGSPRTDPKHAQGNADFIAHSREDVPDLCDLIDALAAENERLRNELDVRTTQQPQPYFTCPKCGSHYFGTDLRTGEVCCHGDSSAGPRRCDWRGVWPQEKAP